MNVKDHIARFLAEFIGTAFLTLFGCMACISTVEIQNSPLQISIAFGLVVMVIITCFGCVSGAFINPAVTIAACIFKLITIPMACYYFVAQILGGIIGFGLLKALVPYNAVRGPQHKYGLCSTVPQNGISVIQAVAIEFLITSALILICCGVWDPRNKNNQDSVSLKFGFGVTVLCCVAGPYTGASMNPARSLGPALWNGVFKDHWVYWVGPLLSAVISSFGYKAILWKDPDQSEDKEA